MQQLVGDCVAAVLGAELGRQNMALTDRLLVFEFRILKVLTSQPIPELLAVNAAPGLRSRLHRGDCSALIQLRRVFSIAQVIAGWLEKRGIL